MAKTVDEFLAGAVPWQAEVTRLRDILRRTGLAEAVKWGNPCYMLDGSNVVGIVAFKSYFGLWFFQGAALSDPAGRLINAQRGRTRAMRQWRMHSSTDIDPGLIRSYVEEAAQLAAGGCQPAPRRPAPALPAELADALAADDAAQAAFATLTPGRQREFAEFIASARRADTRLRRLQKSLAIIRRGKGLNDRYRR